MSFTANCKDIISLPLGVTVVSSPQQLIWLARFNQYVTRYDDIYNVTPELMAS